MIFHKINKKNPAPSGLLSIVISIPSHHKRNGDGNKKITPREIKISLIKPTATISPPHHQESFSPPHERFQTPAATKNIKPTTSTATTATTTTYQKLII